MTNIGFKGSLLSKKLDPKTVNNGGLEIINLPILNCKIASELELTSVEIGGYRSFINYNKFREEQHTTEKFNKSMRKLRRNIRNKNGRMRGETI